MTRAGAHALSGVLSLAVWLATPMPVAIWQVALWCGLAGLAATFFVLAVVAARGPS